MMIAKLRSWWQKIKQHPMATVIIMLAVALGIALLVVLVLGYIFNWGWTGLTPYKNSGLQPGKTLWDWLQLLIIPAVLTVGGYVINLTISRGEQAATEQRALSEREAAEKRAETEREIALDNQREVALQEYIEKMSELLLEKKLRESQPGDEVRTIARVRTMSVLPRLDSNRKRTVFNFLLESSLIGNNNAVVDIHKADFSDTYIGLVSLTGANLEFVNFAKAVLFATTLAGANLMGANLKEADLEEANLKGANLYYADLEGADFTRADLEGAKVNERQLDQISSLEGATMPDGSIHP